MEQRGCKIKDPNDARMSGYLEKKGKMRMVSSWKKYWFVLEGRLLLYYRSRVEYETLSPCKGSINLCPPCEVRPMSSTAGAFQISTRSSTFNLRAEDRSEQEKWMQALLGVLNAQNISSPPKKMSHFRYSFDDLVPMGTAKQGLSRQYTLPPRQRGTTKDCILQRVQQLGGQSYGGSLGTISKLAEKTSKRFSPKIPRQKNVAKMLENSNAQIVIVDEEAASSPDVTRLDDSSTVSSDQEVVLRRGVDTESLYATVDKRSSRSSTNSSKTNLMVDNDAYAILVKNKKLGETDQNKNSVIVENDTYQGVGNGKIKRNSSIVVENEDYQGVTRQRHSTGDILEDGIGYQALGGKRVGSEDSLEGEYETVDQRPSERTSSDLDQLYEDPDNLKTVDFSNCRRNSYAEPMLPPRPQDERKSSLSVSEESTNTSNGHQHHESKKNFKARLKQITQFVHSDKKEGNNNNGSGNNKRRSLSFIRKVLRRKKSYEKEPDVIDPLYDTVDYGIFDREPISQRSSIAKSPDEVIAGTLEELQKKLLEKRNALEEILNSVKLPSNPDPKDVKFGNDSEAEEDSSGHASATTDELIRPNLPPRQNARSSSPFHDVPKNNMPVSAADFQNNNNSAAGLKKELSNIDKILEDLEQEKLSRDTMLNDLSVKQLIERFSGDFKSDSEVILRKPCRRRDSAGYDLEKLALARSKSVASESIPEVDNEEQIKTYRHSDELNQLLEELSKVTCAPLMTPGVTTSLVNDNLTDEEWLTMVPVRSRRYSEPDYDVPRPHRSLQFLPRKELTEKKEQVIPATRFFGPVLAQITTESNTRCSIADTSMSWASMAPDSLEPLQIQQALLKAQERKENQAPEKDRSMASYASQMNNTNTPNKKTNDEPIIPVIVPEEEIFTKMQDVFIDSLEPFPEVSTAF